jgi:restriction endonuclease S subunit
VFRSRGQNNSTALLTCDLDRAIVAAPLLRIRITRPETILPEYLNWYISQQDAQAYFKSRLEGTHGGIISKQTLEELEVLLPPLEKQKIIAEVAALSDREQELVRALAAKKKALITTILMKSAKGE